MQKPLSFLFTALVILATSVAVSAQPTVVLRDTFDDDTLGQAPGSPEIGSSFYWGTGTHTIVTGQGGQGLRSVDSSGAEGYAIQWIPAATPSIFEASFLYRMESFSGGTGTMAYQRFTVSTNTTDENIRLQWKDGGSLELQASTATVPSFSWNTGDSYRVRIKVNCAADTTSLWVDDAPLVTDKALGFDCNAMSDFSEGSDFAFLSTRVLDDLEVVAGDSIFIDGFESDGTSMWSATVPVLDGNTCGSAIPLSGGTLILDLSDNTASGTVDTCGTGNTVDEWVSYTAPCTGTATVNTCYPSTAIDTVVSVWQDASCQGATEVTCNDDASGNPPECDLAGNTRKSLATFSTTLGTTYVFRVSSYLDTVGVYEISAQCAP